MPIIRNPLTSLFPTSVDFTGALSPKDIDLILSNKAVDVLSTDDPKSVPAATWNTINEQLLTERPRIRLVVTDGSVLLDKPKDKAGDFSFLKYLPNLYSLFIQCDWQTEFRHLEALSELPKLRDLSLYIRALTDFECLQRVTKQLKKLSLSETKSKNPSLNVLSRFSALEELFVERHQKDIDVIGALPKLRDLTLRSVSVKDISFIRQIEQLWSLDIKLGGIQDFSPLEGLNNLKYLELWQVRGLSDLSFISTLSGLQFLFLQSLKQVTRLPDLSKLKDLRRIELETMKGLKDISSLKKAPALTEISMRDCRQLQMTDLAGLFEKTPRLKMAGFQIGRSCREEIDALLTRHKIKEWDFDKKFLFKK